MGRYISIVAFALIAGVYGGVSLGSWMGLWHISSAPASSAMVALGVGLIVSIGLGFVVGSKIERDLNLLSRYAEAHRRADLDRSDYKPAMWLRRFYGNLDESFEALRELVAKLNSQRRELEIQVRVVDAERQHAEAILQSISDAVLVTDAFNEVAIANEAAAEALNFELDDAHRQPIEQVIGDRSLVHLIRDARESANLSNRLHFEHVVSQSGRNTIYDVSLSCVSNQQDEVAGVVTILHDVTKEKEISEMKSDFVSSVSHELRTPLSSIKAYVEMLVDGEAEDEQTRQEFYNIIQSETNRLSRLIDNILNISRIESGIQKVQRENLSLQSVIREVFDVMRPQSRAKQIELTEVDKPLFHQIYADKDMIYQALLNLVGNAIKYTPEGGRVTIDTDVDEHAKQVVVSVKDTGVGVPADALPHLFEKFYRVADHKNIAKGTGLGLNLVKHIIETVHNGQVRVESVEGRGSTFYACLPLSDRADNG